MKERIEEKVNKYLGEASEKEAAKKLEKVIKSIDSTKQVETAVNMIVRFADMYSKDFLKNVNPIKQEDLSEKYIDKLALQLGKKYKEGKISKDAIQQISSKLGLTGDKLGIKGGLDKYTK